MAVRTSYDDDQLSDSLSKIAGLLLSEEKLDAILELVVSLACRTIPGVDAASVTLVRDGRYSTAVYSNEIARRVDERQYAVGEGPCLDCAETGHRLSVEDLSKDDRWPRFAHEALGEGIGSVLCVPFSPMGEPIGTLNMYSVERAAFPEADIDTASMFAEQAAIVIANSVAYSSAVTANDQLREALDSRELIGQAKGVLMERERCSSEEAFAILKEVSQRTNRKLRQVAQDVLGSITHE